MLAQTLLRLAEEQGVGTVLDLEGLAA
jgi:hypothetical protein